MVQRQHEKVARFPDQWEIAEERSRGYWFLGNLYLTRPDAAWLKMLQGTSHGTNVKGMDELHEALQDESLELLAERLAVEYTRLLRGVQESYGPPPPYESLYRETRLMGETMVAVVRLYADAGYGVIDETAGPQDHIGVELKFMALLCHDEAGAWRLGDQTTAMEKKRLQKKFLNQHLMTWVPAYCRRIYNDSTEAFYRGAAMLTGQILNEEHAFLSDAPSTQKL